VMRRTEDVAVHLVGEVEDAIKVIHSFTAVMDVTLRRICKAVYCGIIMPWSGRPICLSCRKLVLYRESPYKGSVDVF